MTEPLWYRWNGAVMVPLRPDAAEQQYQIDGRYLLEVSQGARSDRQHRAYFAALNEAWANLGTDDFATPEHLRKAALILTGWRDERTLVCGSKAAAERFAAFARPLDDYAVLTAQGRLLRVWTARSQSYRAMGREDFQRSMDDVLGYCADLVGVRPEELTQA